MRDENVRSKPSNRKRGRDHGDSADVQRLVRPVASGQIGRSPMMEEARQIAAGERTPQNDQPADITSCRNPSDAENLTGSSNTWFDG